MIGDTLAVVTSGDVASQLVCKCLNTAKHLTIHISNPIGHSARLSVIPSVPPHFLCFLLSRITIECARNATFWKGRASQKNKAVSSSPWIRCPHIFYSRRSCDGPHVPQNKLLLWTLSSGAVRQCRPDSTRLRKLPRVLRNSLIMSNGFCFLLLSL